MADDGTEARHGRVKMRLLPGAGCNALRTAPLKIRRAGLSFSRTPFIYLMHAVPYARHLYGRVALRQGLELP